MKVQELSLQVCFVHDIFAFKALHPSRFLSLVAPSHFDRDTVSGELKISVAQLLTGRKGDHFNHFTESCSRLVFTGCRLVLEWNALGLWDEAFALFCEGLASNTALTQLDLRNNQISHHGAAQLAQALVRNSGLEVLGDVKGKCLSVCLVPCVLRLHADL